MLNDMMIRGLKPSEKPQKFFDEKGLFLLLMPSGSRLWRYKYREPISADTIDTMQRRLEAHVFPHMAKRMSGNSQPPTCSPCSVASSRAGRLS